MVVLEGKKIEDKNNSLYSPYVQPPPTEYDANSSPLAMLTKACHKIETALMSENNVIRSAKRASPSLINSSPIKPNNILKRPSSTSSNASERSSISSPKSSPDSDSKKRKSPANSDTSIESKRTKLSPKSSSPASNFSVFNPLLAGGAKNPSETARKSPHPAVCVDPLCREPTCPTFVYRQAQLLSQQSAYLASLSGAAVSLPGLLNPTLTAASLAATTSTPTTSTTSSSSDKPPFVCNWMQGSDCCSRSFSTREELMSHLKSHTSSNVSENKTPTSTKSSDIIPPTSSAAALAALQARTAAAAAFDPMALLRMGGFPGITPPVSTHEGLSPFPLPPHMMMPPSAAAAASLFPGSGFPMNPFIYH